ncbi:MAG: hypothetical protein AAF829_09915 [Pseudomonadota bacterium]
MGERYSQRRRTLDLATFLAIGFALTSAPVAVAEACTVAEFSQGNKDLYIQAENAFIQDKDAQAARAKLNTLSAMSMNCFEQGAMLRFSAALNVELNDYPGAITDLEAAVDRRLLSDEEVKKTHFNIAQLYLAIESFESASRAFDQWIDAGALPTRNQMWQMAETKEKAGDPAGALAWAQKVFEDDGPGAADAVYTFLIDLNYQTGQDAVATELTRILEARRPAPQRPQSGGVEQ